MLTTEPPLSPALLDRLVLRWRRDAPASGQGAHLRRRQGHSLEFREYRAYQRGDDIRAVDWRASARLPRSGELLVRSFEAEERMRLLVLVDNRPEMALPEAMPKLLIALWSARALAQLALRKGDEVVLARLFEGAGPPMVTLRSAQAEGGARDWAEALWQARFTGGSVAVPPLADLDRLRSVLKPAGAVVVVSDLLFDDPTERFVRFARQAQQQRRSLSVMLLNSLPYEIALLRAAATFRMPRPADPGAERVEVFDEQAFHQAGEAVREHLHRLRRRLDAGGLDWPASAVNWPEPKSETATAAQEAGSLKSLFVRDFLRLPLLGGLALGGR